MNQREKDLAKARKWLGNLKSGSNARCIYVCGIEKVCRKHGLNLGEIGNTEEEVAPFKNPKAFSQSESSL